MLVSGLVPDGPGRGLGVELTLGGLIFWISARLHHRAIDTLNAR